MGRVILSGVGALCAVITLLSLLAFGAVGVIALVRIAPLVVVPVYVIGAVFVVVHIFFYARSRRGFGSGGGVSGGGHGL